MMKRKLNWKTPLFFCLLPIFLIMIFLGFPLPPAPPPASKPVQEISVQEHKRKRKRLDRIVYSPKTIAKQLGSVSIN